MNRAAQQSNQDEERGATSNAQGNSSTRPPPSWCPLLPAPNSNVPQGLSARVRDVENNLNLEPDATPEHIDPLLSTIVNLIRRWLISVTPQERALPWPFDWDLKHVTGRTKDQDFLGIRLPLSFKREGKHPNLGPNVHFFHKSKFGYSEIVIHSIITLVTIVRIAESLSSARQPGIKDRVNTVLRLLEALENYAHNVEVVRGVFNDPNATNEDSVANLARKLKKYIKSRWVPEEHANSSPWTINIEGMTGNGNHPPGILVAVNTSEGSHKFVSYKGHLGISCENGGEVQRDAVLEAMAAFTIGDVKLQEKKKSDAGNGEPPSRGDAVQPGWIASILSCVLWIASIAFSWLIALGALWTGELQRRRKLYAMITHVGVQRDLNELIAAACNMQLRKWLFLIIVQTVAVNFSEREVPGSVALSQSCVFLILNEELSWIQKLRQVHGKEAVALAILELHTGYYWRAKFDEHCVDLRIPLAMALVTAFVSFKIASSTIAYNTPSGASRIVPSDSKAATQVIAVLTCITAIVVIHAMNIAMSIAPRLLLSHIRALTGGTLSGSTGLAEAVLDYLDTTLVMEVKFSKWATFVTDQAAVLSRLMWPSVVPWPDDKAAKKTKKNLRNRTKETEEDLRNRMKETEKALWNRMRLSIMRDKSPLPHRSMPIWNQGMFTAMVNHEMDHAGIVAHELACSGSDLIMNSGIYAKFLCKSFSKEGCTTFMERFYNGCIRAKTIYKLDLKRNVYSVQIDEGRFIVARDSIIVGAVPPVPITYNVASPQAAESTSCIKQTLELWNGALRRASDVADSGSYFFDYHEKIGRPLGRAGLSDGSPSNCLVPMWAANGEPVEVITLDFGDTITLSKKKYG